MNATTSKDSGWPTWPIAGGSLAVGFAVATLTGVRPLGGAVLVAALASCWTRWRAKQSTAIASGLTVAYAAFFALSHVIGDAVGTWGAVAVVSTAMALLAWALVDRQR